MTAAPPKNDHPATFSEELWPYFIQEMRGHNRVLDPFAGVGTIHELAYRAGVPMSVGYEIESEWANADLYPGMPRRQIVGDFMADRKWMSFDLILTSPCYGNRMADHHEAKDKSKRNTYRHRLGRMPTEGSSAIMQWGPEYRAFHKRVWAKCYKHQSLYPYGGQRKFVLNIKDHIRKGERMYVTDWHNETLESMGYEFLREHRVPCPGNRQGENHEARIEYESILVYEMKA